MSKQKTISALRTKIDALDDELLRILNMRAQYASDIAREKQNESLKASFYRSEREAVILRRIRAANPGPLSDEEVSRLFQEIMSACLALEKKMLVGFLGPEATFTQQATLKHFGHSVRAQSYDSIEEVFRQIERGTIEYGVVPVENSTEGIVSHTLDQFICSPLKIVGEVQLYIHHYLVSKEEMLAQVETIYSHRQSFAQCRQWLQDYCPHCKQVEVSSTAAAALLTQKTSKSAAIASKNAIEYYGLHALYKNIEDHADNVTRFLVIGCHVVPPSGYDKTSVLVSTKNRPGALARLLKIFADHDISMTRIESRPTRTANWEYVFFIDVEGHAECVPLQSALKQLGKSANLFKLLGSYPRSDLSPKIGNETI